MAEKKERKERIEIIDALRGLAVVLMVIHHFLYDLTAFLSAPIWLFTNPVFDTLHYIFAGLFISLSGVSSQLSRDNIKRGSVTIVLAVAITYLTYRMDMPVWFGVLHLLGFSMLFFGITRGLWDAIPKKIAPFVLASLVIASVITTTYVPIESENLWAQDALNVLGWPQPGFRSFDYFPLLPWIFVFLLGAWAGVYIRAKKLPSWFYKTKPPVFPAIGRKALLVYILHQPILYALVMWIAALIHRP
ncbi:MAG: DUF1624 domain-containing protein [Oscillospiraceae bacterium]|nr:DUF1624 domain-containing protein [Oscillospiraceae bacterium]